MLGVELVTDRQLKTPAKAETIHVMDKMKGFSLSHSFILSLKCLLIDFYLTKL